MELPHPYTCDICNVHKGEANHWYRVWKNPAFGTVVIARWDYAPDHAHQHACGEQHALQIAAQLLGESKRVDVAPEVQE
jgi:hypothetical protein